MHTKFAIRIHVCGVYANQKDPKYEADDPGMRHVPKVEDELGSGEVTGHRYGVVEPVVPGERKAIRGREEACGVGVEGTFTRRMGL